jgi:hypothetical protein
MIENRKDALRRDIERKQRYLASLEAMPDFSTLVDGTVLALAVTLGRSRPYNYVAYKAADKWYLTGERSPNGASSDDLTEWLVSQGRHLVAATVLAEIEQEIQVVDLGALLLASLQEG